LGGQAKCLLNFRLIYALLNFGQERALGFMSLEGSRL